MGLHSKYAPSKAKRYINCPGSIDLEEAAPPKPTSDAAITGTAAHEVGERCLREGKHAVDFVNTIIEVTENKKIHKITVTDDMASAVQIYVDYCRSLFTAESIKLAKTLVFVEQHFEMDFIQKGLFGTSDFSLYDVVNKKLHVVDYKNGYGEVSPIENEQGKVYALGAMFMLWNMQTGKTKKSTELLSLVEEVVITIVQPNSIGTEAVKTWTVPASEVMYWGLHILKPAIEATKQKNARLAVGDWCTFCGAKALCPEQIRKATELAKTSFREPVFPDPKKVSPEDVAKVMEFAGNFSKWAAEVKSYALEGMKAGTLKVPGQKLVMSVSKRMFNADAGVFLKEKLGEEAYDKKLKGIGAIEKALKLQTGLKPAEVKEMLKPICKMSASNMTIAPLTDKRQAVAPPKATVFMSLADAMG